MNFCNSQLFLPFRTIQENAVGATIPTTGRTLPLPNRTTFHTFLHITKQKLSSKKYFAPRVLIALLFTKLRFRTAGALHPLNRIRLGSSHLKLSFSLNSLLLEVLGGVCTFLVGRKDDTFYFTPACPPQRSFYSFFFYFLSWKI